MTPIERALQELRNGNLIGLPTETVYGLAGDATRSDTVSKIYALKNRPHFNPLIAHVCNIEMAKQLGNFSETARRLADKFWPGPMTLVLPKTEQSPVCDLARAGLDTQAIRWPAHEMAQTLISEFGQPVVAPSANRSGKISPTRAEHVRSEFGLSLPVILDGGASVLGLESTVLAVQGETITLLRAGSLARQQIEDVVGEISSATIDDTSPKSPGMLSRHYSPNAKLRLNAEGPIGDEAFLGFGSKSTDFTLNLSRSGDVQEAAANLYAMLRELDEMHSAIAVAPIPMTGLGEAINDRLARAALRETGQNE